MKLEDWNILDAFRRKCAADVIAAMNAHFGTALVSSTIDLMSDSSGIKHAHIFFGKKEYFWASRRGFYIYPALYFNPENPTIEIYNLL